MLIRSYISMKNFLKWIESHLLKSYLNKPKEKVMENLFTTPCIRCLFELLTTNRWTNKSYCSKISLVRNCYILNNSDIGKLPKIIRTKIKIHVSYQFYKRKTKRSNTCHTSADAQIENHTHTHTQMNLFKLYLRSIVFNIHPLTRKFDVSSDIINFEIFQ